MNPQDTQYGYPKEHSYQQAKRRRLDVGQQPQFQPLHFQPQQHAPPSIALSSTLNDQILKNQKLLKQLQDMKRIAQSAREEGPATRPMKESKRAEAFKKITRSGATAEVDTHLKEPKRKTVMMKMENSTSGPLKVLYDCMTLSIKAKVWIRRYHGLRGVITGYIVAFDNHMNLAMIDVDEVYTIESWMVNEPLAKYKKRRRKKQQERRLVKGMEQGQNKDQFIGTAYNKDATTPLSVRKPKKATSAESTNDFLKKLTQNIKSKPFNPNNANQTHIFQKQASMLQKQADILKTLSTLPFQQSQQSTESETESNELPTSSTERPPHQHNIQEQASMLQNQVQLLQTLSSIPYGNNQQPVKPQIPSEFQKLRLGSTLSTPEEKILEVSPPQQNIPYQTQQPPNDPNLPYQGSIKTLTSSNAYFQVSSQNISGVFPTQSNVKGKNPSYSQCPDENTTPVQSSLIANTGGTQQHELLSVLQTLDPSLVNRALVELKVATQDQALTIPAPALPGQSKALLFSPGNDYRQKGANNPEIMTTNPNIKSSVAGSQTHDLPTVDVQKEASKIRDPRLSRSSSVKSESSPPISPSVHQPTGSSVYRTTNNEGNITEERSKRKSNKKSKLTMKSIQTILNTVHSSTDTPASATTSVANKTMSGTLVATPRKKSAAATMEQLIDEEVFMPLDDGEIKMNKNTKLRNDSRNHDDYIDDDEDDDDDEDNDDDEDIYGDINMNMEFDAEMFEETSAGNEKKKKKNKKVKKDKKKKKKKKKRDGDYKDITKEMNIEQSSIPSDVSKESAKKADMSISVLCQQTNDGNKPPSINYTFVENTKENGKSPSYASTENAKDNDKPLVVTDASLENKGDGKMKISTVPTEKLTDIVNSEEELRFGLKDTKENVKKSEHPMIQNENISKNVNSDQKDTLVQTKTSDLQQVMEQDEQESQQIESVHVKLEDEKPNSENPQSDSIVPDTTERSDRKNISTEILRERDVKIKLEETDEVAATVLSQLNKETSQQTKDSALELTTRGLSVNDPLIETIMSEDVTIDDNAGAPTSSRSNMEVLQDNKTSVSQAKTEEKASVNDPPFETENKDTVTKMETVDECDNTAANILLLLANSRPSSPTSLNQTDSLDINTNVVKEETSLFSSSEINHSNLTKEEDYPGEPLNIQTEPEKNRVEDTKTMDSPSQAEEIGIDKVTSQTSEKVIISEQSKFKAEQSQKKPEEIQTLPANFQTKTKKSPTPTDVQSETEKCTTAVDDIQTKTEECPITSDDVQTKTEECTTPIDDVQTNTEESLTTAEECLITSDDVQTKTEENPTTADDVQTKTEESPTTGDDQTKNEVFPITADDIQTKTEDSPTKEDSVQTKTKEIPSNNRKKKNESKSKPGNIHSKAQKIEINESQFGEKYKTDEKANKGKKECKSPSESHPIKKDIIKNKDGSSRTNQQNNFTVKSVSTKQAKTKENLLQIKSVEEKKDFKPGEGEIKNQGSPPTPHPVKKENRHSTVGVDVKDGTDDGELTEEGEIKENGELSDDGEIKEESDGIKPGKKKNELTGKSGIKPEQISQKARQSEASEIEEGEIKEDGEITTDTEEEEEREQMRINKRREGKETSMDLRKKILESRHRDKHGLEGRGKNKDKERRKHKHREEDGRYKHRDEVDRHKHREDESRHKQMEEDGRHKHREEDGRYKHREEDGRHKHREEDGRHKHRDEDDRHKHREDESRHRQMEEDGRHKHREEDGRYKHREEDGRHKHREEDGRNKHREEDGRHKHREDKSRPKHTHDHRDTDRESKEYQKDQRKQQGKDGRKHSEKQRDDETTKNKLRERPSSKDRSEKRLSKPGDDGSKKMNPHHEESTSKEKERGVNPERPDKHSGQKTEKEEMKERLVELKRNEALKQMRNQEMKKRLSEAMGSPDLQAEAAEIPLNVDPTAEVSNLNIFQRRKHQSNIDYEKTYVKRTYGWLRKDDEPTVDASGSPVEKTDDVSSKTDVFSDISDIYSDVTEEEEPGKKINEHDNLTVILETQDIPEPDFEVISEDLQPEESDGTIPQRKKQNLDEERRKWREEAKKRQTREKETLIIEKLLGKTFKPKVPVPGLIHKRRHLNQLFIRGDNVVLVAYEKPANIELLKAERAANAMSNK